ncbi:hypothetical protein IT570_13240 [Candidatus Sumerlaeota bacterium]|nr:hypothetical protein [Candidatus Sumerlaeota bacterium]
MSKKKQKSLVKGSSKEVGERRRKPETPLEVILNRHHIIGAERQRILLRVDKGPALKVQLNGRCSNGHEQVKVRVYEIKEGEIFSLCSECRNKSITRYKALPTEPEQRNIWATLREAKKKGTFITISSNRLESKRSKH